MTYPPHRPTHTPNPSPPPTLLPNLQCTQGISPGSTCTFHNRLIQLNITPAEGWVTLSVELLLPLFPPFFLPLSGTFSSSPLLTLLSLIHVITRSPNCLGWPPPCFREIPTAVGMPWCWSLTKEYMCVLRTHGEQFDWILPIQEHGQISWAEWDLIRAVCSSYADFFFFVVTHSLKLAHAAVPQYIFMRWVSQFDAKVNQLYRLHVILPYSLVSFLILSIKLIIQSI